MYKLVHNIQTGGGFNNVLRYSAKEWLPSYLTDNEAL